MWDWFFNNYYNNDSDSTSSAASAVPEMDAASGTLAIAVVMAALLLAWEIKRRRARD